MLLLVIGGAVFGGLSFLLDPVTAAFTAYLATAMAAITVSDFRHFIIPDFISLPAIPVGIAANVLVIHGSWNSGLQESLTGAMLAGGVLYIVRAAYFRLRGGEGLGLGDVKLGVVSGAWIGPGLLAPACLLASLSALLAVLLLTLTDRSGPTQKLQIPFGCFIAPATLLTWAFRLYGTGLAA